MEHTALSTAANKKNWPSSHIKLCQKSHNWTQSVNDKTSARTVLFSWFSAIKSSDGIQLSLMNSYQIPEAMLFWAPWWEAACRRVLLSVQNDRTLQILFCIWQCSQCQLHCSMAFAFPACLCCTNWQDASLPVSYYLSSASSCRWILIRWKEFSWILTFTWKLGCTPFQSSSGCHVLIAEPSAQDPC